ncbi:hypothetical protein [Amycolatopsis anabasis]|uniref:hypothetical protein n=1 Tax=Amycolatopsis anabasis TaxID=1840409 RepID=UPI00131DB9AA|nr:hypothetical protein [Amycolatopsis anabasis]
MSVDNSGSRRRSWGKRAFFGAAAATLAVLTAAPAVAAADPAPGGRNRDITLDSKEDVISRKANGALTVYPHSGSFDAANAGATYQNGVAINWGWNNASWISAGNVTNDLKTDILAQVGGIVTAYQHSGAYDPANPTATLGKTQQFGGAGWDLFDLKLQADFNGDGIDDVVGRRGDKLYVWPVVPDASDKIQVYPAQQIGEYFDGIDQLDIADLNADTLPDAIVREGDQLVVYYGQPTQQAQSRSAAGAPFTASVVFSKNRVSSPQARTAAAAVPQYQIISGGWSLADRTVVKDVNLDGKPDIVSRLKSDGQLLAFLNTGVAADGTVGFSGRNYLGAKWVGDSFIN